MTLLRLCVRRTIGVVEKASLSMVYACLSASLRKAELLLYRILFSGIVSFFFALTGRYPYYLIPVLLLVIEAGTAFQCLSRPIGKGGPWFKLILS